MDLSLTYKNIFTPAATDEYVNQTPTLYGAYYPWGTIGTDPGGMANTWLCLLSSLGGVTQAKFNVDLGEAVFADRLKLRNQNNGSTSYADAGIKDFILYGSNSQAAFENTTYADLTDLTALGTFQATMDIGNPLTDQYFNLPGTQAFRYYIMRISSNWGSASYMGIRHLVFQVERDVPITINYPNIVCGAVYSGTRIDRTDRHHLGGVIKVNGVPARKRIVVFEKSTHIAVASTVSDPETGVWRIAYIKEYPLKGLFAISFDDTQEFNAEVFDHVSQVVKPV